MESDGSEYPQTRAWALTLHDQYPDAEGLIWTSRQADPAQAIVLFEDRLKGVAFSVHAKQEPLLLADGAAIHSVLDLALKMDVFLTP
ncbi:RES domain-containing protein [Edaphobacter sp.]|uniref:RES domain-containing protein n=1 Tax=Edaphobacter sp. TaxID=1934404 RepID=UPI00345C44BB